MRVSDLEELEKKSLKKGRKREAKKKPKMKVDGAKAKDLYKIIITK